MRYEKLFALVLAILFSVPLLAQTPYPRTRRATTKLGVATPGSYKDVAASFHGTLKQLNKNEVVLQNEQEQTVVIRRSKKTRFLMDGKEIKAGAIAMNTLVTVEAIEDIDLKPIAVSVSIDTPSLEPDKP